MAGEKMTLDNIKNAVASAAPEFHITKASLFGSRARGDFRDSSDVDLIIEFDETKFPVTLLTLSMVKQRLEELLAADVDIIHGPVLAADMLDIDKQVDIYAKSA